MHVDPLAARRAMFGEPVVHGANTALWAIDQFLGGRSDVPRRFVVNFPRPSFLGEDLELTVQSSGADRARLRVVSGESMLVGIRLELGGQRWSGADERQPPQFLAGPRVLSLADLESLRGELIVPTDDGELKRLFPNLCGAVGEAVVAQL